MARTKKIVNSTAEVVLRSEGFLQVIALLEADHPVKRGLEAAATIEHRALKQVRDQEYESILIKLRALASQARARDVESTYEENLIKK